MFNYFLKVYLVMLAVVGVVCILLALFPPKAHGKGDSLEWTLAYETQHGPQFESLHGCYEYGRFVRSITREVAGGVPLSEHLRILDEIYKVRANKGLPVLPGMQEFLESEIHRIHGSSIRDPDLAESAARSNCRYHNGMSWKFSRVI